MIGFNGTGLILPPTTASWSTQDSLGTNGNGQDIYPTVREFQMMWNLSSQGELFQLIDYFEGIRTVGTLTATLPAWGTNTFQYRNYSGTIMIQPEFQEYFNEEYTSQVRVTLRVRT